MGVPKFFRYISERYPCLSEIIKDYQIPDFDNLYLDMNGIIHMCSHPDDGDAHFRITEEKIFEDVFHYIEVLFQMIKPRQLFFMAVDGVAPRAKMNQQRGRRFRTAKDAVALENKALERGEELPKEDRFDSNCITPGTEFMVRLHEQLKYLVVSKISTDKLWQRCKVVLSGHETPGEGEHKIMDYIRYMKAQPGYDPNTRHCLYGLDADLIMLGLCTHEPHFSLLREEVHFGKKATKRKNVPERTTFYLLHLSLMREYLKLEFYNLKDSLTFEYDMEKIIDDWVLMGFLVGNDFIPHLPNMHIADGALPTLYKAYMNTLPKLGGYINESGILNLKRFETFLSELASLDLDHFTEIYANYKWLESKRGGNKGKRQENDEFVVFQEEENAGGNSDLSSLIRQTEMLLDDNSKKDGNSLIDNEEDLFICEFIQHKTDYYRNKLELKDVTAAVLQSQAEEYVRAIQWNLNYYYSGVCSWSWYYPHHYAPYISDIKGFTNLKLSFDLGKPFMPYEQLLAVLPAASKSLLPIPYQELMVEENSPIKEFYPEDFKTDLNGKKQDWEALVLIPFIDQVILLDTMAQQSHRLTSEETNRNCHGPMLIYNFTSKNLGVYPAPAYFLPIPESQAAVKLVSIEEIRVPEHKLIKGVYPGAHFDVYYPGFPTLKHLKYKGTLEKWKVKVFDQPSRGENMVLHVLKEDEELPVIDAIANELLGKTVHVGWPHLVEALVTAVSSEEYQYQNVGTGHYNVEENKGKRLQVWHMECQAVAEHYKERLGVNVGDVDLLVHVKILTGKKYIFTPQGQISFEKQWANVGKAYPLQTVVKNIVAYEEKHKVYNDISNAFPVGAVCFMLGQPGYGSQGQVIEGKDALDKGRIKLSFKFSTEPDLSAVVQLDRNIRTRFMNLNVASTKLAISRSLFSRLTGAIFVSPGSQIRAPSSDLPKINVGLNLKFNKKNEEIPGYTRKDESNFWSYSEKAVQLVNDYLNKYPMVAKCLNSYPSQEVYFEDDMFPKGKTKAILSDLTSWLKQQPFYSIERISCGSEIIDPEAIQKLETVIDEFNCKTCESKQNVMQVKPYLLYKPGLQFGNLTPDPNAKFLLWDRVVNVRECYTVPLGHKGTVVGIHKSTTEEDNLLDVLFDCSFNGGMSFNGCSPKRGYRMAKPALLNISYGLRAREEKVNVVHNQKVPNPNSINPPPLNMRPNFPPQPPQIWAQPPPFHLPYNPQFNYHGPPPQLVPYMNQGPNTFVPYKGNSQFQLAGPPPNFGPPLNYQPHPPLMPPGFNPPAIGPPGTGSGYYDNRSSFQPGFNGNSMVPLQLARGETNFLKHILKVDESNSQNQPAPNAGSHPSHYTAMLMKEFQLRNLGCPNYQFFDGNQSCTVKVIFPDGGCVVGEQAPNREVASENAAKEAIAVLNKQATAVWGGESSSNPSPSSNRPKPNNLKEVHSLILGHLQIGKPPEECNAAVIDRSIPKERELQEPLLPVSDANQVAPVTVTPVTVTPVKRRRERKMRLAANFSNAMTD